MGHKHWEIRGICCYPFMACRAEFQTTADWSVQVHSGKSKRGQQSWSWGSRQRCLFSLEADDIYEFVARIIIN